MTGHRFRIDWRRLLAEDVTGSLQKWIRQQCGRENSMFFLNSANEQEQYSSLSLSLSLFLSPSQRDRERNNHVFPFIDAEEIQKTLGIGWHSCRWSSRWELMIKTDGWSTNRHRLALRLNENLYTGPSEVICNYFWTRQ